MNYICKLSETGESKSIKIKLCIPLMFVIRSGNMSSYPVTKYDKLDKKEKKSLKKKCRKIYNNKGFFESIIDFLNPLNDCMSCEYKPIISSFIYKVIDYLIKEGINTVGTFRLPSNNNLTNELVNYIKINKEVNLKDYDILTIANALKKYLREELNGLISDDLSITLEKI